MAVTVPRRAFSAGSLFALDRFQVSGNERARTADILAALGALAGRNLVTLGLLRIADRLAENPWVDRVTLAKRFPDGLAVQVVERRPVALVSEEGRLFWVGRGRPLDCALRSSRRPGRVRPRPAANRAHASRARRPARGAARATARVLLRAFGNFGLARRRIRYDGFHLPKTGSSSSAGRLGEDRRAARSATARWKVADGRRRPSTFVLRTGSFLSAPTAQGTPFDDGAPFFRWLSRKISLSPATSARPRSASSSGEPNALRGTGRHRQGLVGQPRDPEGQHRQRGRHDRGDQAGGRRGRDHGWRPDCPRLGRGLGIEHPVLQQPGGRRRRRQGSGDQPGGRGPGH